MAKPLTTYVIDGESVTFPQIVERVKHIKLNTLRGRLQRWGWKTWKELAAKPQSGKNSPWRTKKGAYPIWQERK